MSDLVQFTKDNGIAVITINNPPVNALSPGVPEGISEAIERINNDPEIKAAVLIGGGHLGQSYRGENRTELDWRQLAESARTVWELFPAMRGTNIVRAWAGIEARMPDERPSSGRAARAKEFSISLASRPMASSSDRVSVP